MLLLRRGRFGSGSVEFSFSKELLLRLPQQFPFAGSLQKELITLKACVFFMNSCTFGLSCTPPRWCWQPKKFSRGP